MSKFRIDLKTFYNFTRKAEYYYSRKGSPYHNFYHGVSVAHAGYHLLKSLECFEDILDDSLKFAFVLGCFGHDLDHNGRNNVFHCSTRSKLAIRYHDESPLERHHAAILFKMICNYKGDKSKLLPNGEYTGEDDCNILRVFEQSEFQKLRKYIIEIILATDMKFHFELLGRRCCGLTDRKISGQAEAKQALEKHKRGSEPDIGDGHPHGRHFGSRQDLGPGDEVGAADFAGVHGAGSGRKEAGRKRQ